jgi:hypothetical protein
VGGRDFVKVGALLLLIVGALLLLGGALLCLLGASWLAEPSYDYSPFDSDAGLRLLAMGLIPLALGAGLLVTGMGMWNRRD